jgi:sigma-B regulation protein RsbU (phosphoserine phosphatase)
VGNIARAVTVLGRGALRSLVLSISVRDALRHQQLPDFDITGYWEHLLRCAVSARLLGPLAGLAPEECFTAGLLADFGLLALFHALPAKAGAWPELRTLDPQQRHRVERRRLGTTHDQIAQMLARAWVLPETLTEALGNHHHCDALDRPQAGGLCRVLHQADWMAAVFGSADPAPVLERCRHLLRDDFGRDAEAANELLAAVPGQVEEAAAGLGLGVSEQADFDTLLREANLRLAEENLSYQELNWRLTKTLKERDRLAAELNRELETAAEIQRSLLPRPQAERFPVVGVNVPAKELSGDFYDFFALGDGRICFNLADVSGKGITAALLMAKTSSLFRCLGKHMHDPALLLELINQELCETSVHGMFVTMIAGLYDPADGSLSLVNAGHPPALLLGPADALVEVAAQAPPLGISPAVSFGNTELQLRGASLYLFSDGVSEMRLPDGDMLGVGGLVQVLRGLAKLPPRQRVQTLVARLTERVEEVRDDVTVLLLEEPDERT